MSDNNLSVCNKVKYLGHIITEQMTDDEDIYRQRRMLYVQANILLRKFGACADVVKMSLFRAYCTPLYTAHLWSNYGKTSLQRLKVAYNDAMRTLLRQPRWCSASNMFVAAGVSTLEAILRHHMYKFICRINDSKNVIIVALSNIRVSTTRYESQLWRHWYRCLVVGH